jgi:hypothetical protein
MIKHSDSAAEEKKSLLITTVLKKFQIYYTKSGEIFLILNVMAHKKSLNLKAIRFVKK